MSDSFPSLDPQGVARMSNGHPSAVVFVSSPNRDSRSTLVEGVAYDISSGRLLDPDHPPPRPDLLDGQFLMLSVGHDGLTATTDYLGFMSLFWARRGDAWVLSNSVEVLGRTLDLRALDTHAAAQYLSVGWACEDRTLLDGVRVAPPGTAWRWSGEAPGPRADTYYSRDRLLAKGSRPDTTELASELVSRCRAAASGHDGLTSAITAGLDSRLVLALLRAASLEVSYFTAGHRAANDSRAAEEIAAMLGVPHEVIEDVSAEDVARQWDQIAPRLLAETDGLVSLWQVANVLSAPRIGAHEPLLFWGIGGEIARGRWAQRRDVLDPRPDRVLRSLVQRRVSSASLLTDDCRAVGHRTLTRFCDDAVQEGFGAHDVPSLFYTYERVRRWSGANGRKGRETVARFAPLATRPLVEAAFAMSAAQRYHEPLHHRLLKQLNPRLHSYPLEGRSWRLQVPYASAVWDSLLTRRKRTATRAGPSSYDQTLWFEMLRGRLAGECLDESSSPIWSLVDRRSFEQLMLRDEAAPERKRHAVLLTGIVTLFYYERQRASRPTVQQA